jgi:hypothetical protein
MDAILTPEFGISITCSPFSDVSTKGFFGGELLTYIKAINLSRLGDLDTLGLLMVVFG